MLDKKNVVGFCLASLFIIYSSLAFAQSYLEVEELLYVGETKLFSVKKPSRVAVGNPEVVDVINVADTSITLAAKGVGATTFIYWDIFGEHSYQIRVLTQDMTETKRRIDTLLKELKLPKVYTKSNDEEGKVILLGEVKNDTEKERIDLALGSLKSKALDLIQVKDEGVVEIEVKVLELDKDASKTLGFTWPGSITYTEPGPEAVDTESKELTAGKTLSTFFDITNWTRSAFNLTVDFLIQEGKARILSAPKLACLSGKEAELLVGGEKPLFTTAIQSTAGSSTSVEYKEYGIKLKIKPTITNEENINVSLNVEVSEIGTVETIGDPNAPTASAYPMTKRNVSTELYLRDGQTLAIGGLIKQKKSEDVRKTPFLGDIPILGALFRKRSVSTGGGAGERGDIELFITLTPKIVSKSEASVEVAKQIPEISIESNIPEELKDYIRDIQSRIVNAAYYPPDASVFGWEGIVKLSLHIINDGELREAEILQSSGYKILDEAALDIVRRQAPYPSFPQHVKLYELRIEIPIAYRKDN